MYAGSQNGWKPSLSATVNHQLYEGDDTPLIIAIVVPLMKRVHKEKNLSLLISLLIQRNTIRVVTVG